MPPDPRDLRLRPPHLEDEAAARAAQEQLQKDRFNFMVRWEEGVSWPDLVERVRQQRVGGCLPPGWVSSTFLVATVGDAIVGRAQIRHQLNDFLLAEGGQIGYAVLAAYRRHGYATEILRQSLVIARSYGADRVLVTCDEDNVGSAAVIERCGGVLENIVETAGGAPRKKRYWIA